MANELISSFNPHSAGLIDLDDMDTAERIAAVLEGYQLANTFRLDLTQCYLDYRPCSILMEHLLNMMAKLPGAKSIDIDTTVELGKPDHYVMLLFRCATSIAKGESDLEKVMTNVKEYLLSQKCSIHIRIFSADGENVVEPIRSFKLFA